MDTEGWQAGRAMATYSKTWWWSHWKVLHQIMVQFGDVEHFLTNVDVGAAVTHSYTSTGCSQKSGVAP